MCFEWRFFHSICFFFFFNDTSPTEIYTLSLHDALPICERLRPEWFCQECKTFGTLDTNRDASDRVERRSEEHTSELQSQSNLVCRLLLEKKKKQQNHIKHIISYQPTCPDGRPLTSTVTD